MSQNCKTNLRGDVSVSILTDKGSKPNLLTLPDVPLLCILQYVPLQSLYDLPLVNSRFVPLCDLVLKQRPRQRLVLYIGDLESIQKFKCSFRIGIPFGSYLVDANGMHRFYEPEFYRLHYLTLNDETLVKLVKLVTLMPSITHLEMVISEVNHYLLHKLICLLTHWASTLKWLKFGCVNFQPGDSWLLLTLIREINLKLSVLEHLTLDLDGDLLTTLQNQHRDRQRQLNPRGEPDLLHLDLPILGRLKEFLFQTKDKYFVRILLNSLERQAGEQLTEMGLGLPFSWEHYRSNLVDHPFAARFTLINTRYEPPFAPTSFPNLKGYIAHWHLNEPFNLCTRKLISLQNLQYLELRRLSHSNDDNGNGLALDPFAPVSLPSVEIMRIHFNNSPFSPNDHTVLRDDAWASLFPSVQIVNLIHLGDFCAKCYPKEDGNCCDKPPGFEQSAERTACLSQLLAPLTVLPSLRKIFYQRNDDLKNIAEFTGKGVFVKTHAYIY